VHPRAPRSACGDPARFNEESEGLCISTIVLTDLLHGAAKSARPAENRRAVQDFAARLEGAGL
jgi:tRNA(fMet)-specific endonuclease VapC